MYFNICILIFFYNVWSASGEIISQTSVMGLSVNNITEALLAILGNYVDTDSDKIKDLKEKLTKIDNYVIDKEKYAELLLNESKNSNLSEINFYKALIDQDPFLKKNDSINLYMTMKGRMNRDDLITILSNKKGKSKKARRAGKDVDADRPHKSLDDAVDKYLGEAVDDKHKFGANDTYNKYWDPIKELEDKQENRQASARRLFKGERTTIRYYPFMVSIHVMRRFWCGGVLYWQDLVITSAACLQLLHNNRFYRESPQVVTVRLGSNHSRVGGEMVDALEVYFYPSYNPKTLENNIALIRLRRHIEFTYHRIPKLIEVSDNVGGIPFNAEVVLLGWGVTKRTQKLPIEPLFLQRKILPIYPKKFCQEIYGEKFITNTMFCAGTITTGEGACSHDAGGPAILGGKLVGIISFGPSVCGFPNAPTVFTLVGAYRDWMENINETIPEYVRGYKRTTTTTVDPIINYFYAVTPRTRPSIVTVQERLKDLFEEKHYTPRAILRNRVTKQNTKEMPRVQPQVRPRNSNNKVQKVRYRNETPNQPPARVQFMEVSRNPDVVVRHHETIILDGQSVMPEKTTRNVPPAQTRQPPRVANPTTFAPPTYYVPPVITKIGVVRVTNIPDLGSSSLEKKLQKQAKEDHTRNIIDSGEGSDERRMDDYEVAAGGIQMKNIFE